MRRPILIWTRSQACEGRIALLWLTFWVLQDPNSRRKWGLLLRKSFDIMRTRSTISARSSPLSQFQRVCLFQAKFLLLLSLEVLILKQTSLKKLLKVSAISIKQAEKQSFKREVFSQFSEILAFVLYRIVKSDGLYPKISAHYSILNQYKPEESLAIWYCKTKLGFWPIISALESLARVSNPWVHWKFQRILRMVSLSSTPDCNNCIVL